MTVLGFLHLSATCVAEIAKSNHLKGCPHTSISVSLSLRTFSHVWCLLNKSLGCGRQADRESVPEMY